MKEKRSESSEIRVIFFGMLNIGILLMIISAVRYGILNPNNIGRVYFSVSFLLLSLVLFFLGVYLFRENDFVVKNMLKRLHVFEKSLPVVVTLLMMSGIVFVITKYVVEYYPFFGMEMFKIGLFAAYFSASMIVSSTLMVKLKHRLQFLKKYKSVLALLDNHYVMIFALVAIISLVYQNSLEGALLKEDDLYLLNYARDTSSPFAGFRSGPERYSSFFRPLIYFVMWFYYRWFGLDYVKYQLVMLVGHSIVGSLFYWFLFKINRNRIISLALAVYFSIHIFISVGVIYVTAVVLWWFGLFCLVFLFYFLKPVQKNSIYLGLAILLFVFLFSAEYAFGLIFAIGLTALYAGISKEMPWRQTLSMLALAVFVVGVYFLLRWQAVGILPQGGGGSSGYFFQFYNNPRPIGLSFYIYTIAANFVATFFPIFDQVGVMMPHTIIQIGTSILIFGVYLVLLIKKIEYKITSYVLIPVFFGMLFESNYIIENIRSVPAYYLAFAFSLHAMSNVSIWILLSQWRKKVQQNHKVLAIFGMGLILGSSIVSLFYFRWRTHYLALMGWILLVALGMIYIKNIRHGGTITICLLLISVFSYWYFADGLEHHLPNTTVKEHQYNLCDQSLTDDFVDEVVDYYHIFGEAIASCR